MNSSPWAKLTTSMMPKMSVRPEATSARIMPVTMPLTVWMTMMSQGMLEPARAHSQVLVDDGVVHLQLRGDCMMAHRALLHEVDALARLQRQRHVLLDQQDGHALAMQHVDDLLDLADHARHQALGRLVEQDDLGLQHHGPADGEHLLLAARQRAAGLVAPLGQERKVVEQLGQQLLLARLADAGAVEAGAQVLHDGQQLEDAAILGNVGNAHAGDLVGGRAADRLAFEQHSSLARVDDTHDGLERRALADAVAAQQAHHLAAPHRQRHAVQDMALAVESVDVFDDDEWIGDGAGRGHVLR